MLEKGYGASVRGSWHVKNKLPNQDAYLIYHHSDYTLAVVCDGLGSKKHSKRGSRKLSKILKKEIHKQFKKKSFDFERLIVRVSKRWRISVFPFKARDCDTTCLFALVGRKNILLGQIGDGMIALKDQNTVHILSNDVGDFSNETRSFYHSSSKHWETKSFKRDKNLKYSVLLCTDGISGDLILEQLSDFIEDVSNGITCNKSISNSDIEELLKNWPNNFSTDDKTLVVVKPNE